MDIEIANSLFGYFKTLYKLNQKPIKLCGTDVIEKYEYSHKAILDIIQDIPRLIPYFYNKKTSNIELANNNGLLEYSDKLKYLYDDYQKVLDNNYDFINNIRLIRNKHEHKMHDVKRRSSGSGTTTFFDFDFEVNEEIISIEAFEFIKLFKMLNDMFSKLVEDVKVFASNNDKESYAYYKRITRFNFSDFNKIYDSDLLRVYGRLLQEF